MAQVVSFINMKGGVGKTTLAVNVAYGLAYFHKKKVLIVDADPQFNATQYLLEDNRYLKHLKDEKGTLSDIFIRRQGRVDTISGTAKKNDKGKISLAKARLNIFDGGTGRGKLDLIPSTLQLMEIETSKRGTENNLRRFIAEQAMGYDYVIIDCPPTISIFTQAAILASTMYLVPIKPDPLSVIGLPLLERWLGEFTDDNGMNIESVGLVFTLVRGPIPNRMQEVMDELRALRKDQVFNTYLSQADCVARSVEDHQPVFLYKKSHKTAGQILAITKEFLDRTGA
ncbi:MAG: ParA family protein [Nitrospirota bacterium]|nr:ParA family protein [Nitrospirota bacterium]